MPLKPPTPPSRFAPLATLACLIVITLILLSLPATTPLKKSSATQPTTAASTTTRPTLRPQTWYLFSFAFTIPALAISMYVRHRLRQRNRPITGRCLTCGQEFKGVVDQCPQCGSTFLEQYSTKGDADD